MGELLDSRTLYERFRSRCYSIKLDETGLIVKSWRVSRFTI